MARFVWKMTEADWKQMRQVHESHQWGDGISFFGCCLFGKICFEFHHTLDISAWFPYTETFVLGEDNGYGNLEDGTPYDCVDLEITGSFFEAGSFEEFKSKFEEEMIEWATQLNDWSQGEPIWADYYGEVERHEM